VINLCTEADRVVFYPTVRQRDVLMSVDLALRTALTMERLADMAELEPGTLATKIQGLQVESFDGKIALRLHVGTEWPLSLTATAARKVAELIRFKAQQAEFKMRLLVAGE
jgi:hypothetical protein